MKTVFDEHYKQKFIDANLLPGGDLKHLISDAATMQIIRWTKGGFGMAAHNYDGDMLTDEIAQVHRSPGFITSNLIGKNEDGSYIKEFEASHGTVTDLWDAHLKGEETSLNPLGLVEALIGAMNHSADLVGGDAKEKIHYYTTTLRRALHNTFRYGQGTKDMAGPEGFSTEKFIDKVAWRLGRYIAAKEEEVSPQDFLLVPSLKFRRNYNVDRSVLEKLFAEYDTENKGSIGVDALEDMLAKLGVAPMKDPLRRGSASLDVRIPKDDANPVN